MPGQRPHSQAAQLRGECAATCWPLPVHLHPSMPHWTMQQEDPGDRCILILPLLQVLSELVLTRHLKLNNTTEIPHYFRLLVSRPFSICQDGAGWSHEEETISVSKQLVLQPQENMLVSTGPERPAILLHGICYPSPKPDSTLHAILTFLDLHCTYVLTHTVPCAATAGAAHGAWHIQHEAPPTQAGTSSHVPIMPNSSLWVPGLVPRESCALSGA